MVSLAVILEPVRILTFVFITMSERQRDYSKYPPIYDLLWGRTSPIIATLQYYSTLLSGGTSRLRIIYSLAGCGSFEDWTEAYPEQVMFVRRLILSASGLIYLRHIKKLRHLMPLALGDRRRPLVELECIAKNIHEKRACCIAVGYFRTFRQKHDVESMLSPLVQIPMFFRAWEILGSIRVLERVHGSDTRAGNKDHVPVTFVTNHINRQFRYSKDNDRKLNQKNMTPVANEIDVVVDRTSSGMIRCSKFAQSGMQLFFFDQIALNRAYGVHTNIEEVWKDVKINYGKLPPDRIDLYESQAQIVKSMLAFQSKCVSSVDSFANSGDDQIVDQAHCAPNPTLAQLWRPCAPDAFAIVPCQAGASLEEPALPKEALPCEIQKIYGNLGALSTFLSDTSSLGDTVVDLRSESKAEQDGMTSMSSEVLRAVYCSDLGNGSVYGNARKDLWHRCCGIELSQSMPEELEYEVECQDPELCETVNSENVINFRNFVVSLIGDLCKLYASGGKLANVASGDVVVALESFVTEVDAEPQQVVFALAEVGLGRYYRYQEEVSWALLEPNEDC